ncbi:MAG: hypothetical protein APR55_04985 [Methanolinea sp. SDB]|nr:MAG: hypothetical protein APR55_04985 [Methanolinea sp. SDB]
MHISIAKKKPEVIAKGKGSFREKPNQLRLSHIRLLCLSEPDAESAGLCGIVTQKNACSFGIKTTSRFPAEYPRNKNESWVFI